MSFGVDPNPYVADFFDGLTTEEQVRMVNIPAGWPLAGIMAWLDDVAVFHGWTSSCQFDLFGGAGFNWQKYLPQEVSLPPAGGIPSGLNLSSCLHVDFWRFFRDAIAFVNFNVGEARTGVDSSNKALVGDWPTSIDDFLKKPMPDQVSYYRHTARGTGGYAGVGGLSDNGGITIEGRAGNGGLIHPLSQWDQTQLPRI